jgi:hypothetical protein
VPACRAPVISFSNSFAALDEDKGMKSPKEKTEQEKLITKYQDEVVATLIKERSPEGAWNNESLFGKIC